MWRAVNQMRWHTVTNEANATHVRPHANTHSGRPRLISMAVPIPMMSRSVRSAIPSLATTPTDSARARVRNGGCTDDRADTADDRPRTNGRVVHVKDRVSSKRSKHGTITQTVKRRVKEGTKTGASRRHTRERPIDGIAEHHDRESDASLPDPPLRDADDRDGDSRDRSGDRHHVGGYPARARTRASGVKTARVIERP